MLAVADLAPLRPTMLAVASCTRQHANLLVPRQIVSSLVGVAFVWLAFLWLLSSWHPEVYIYILVDGGIIGGKKLVLTSA
jgi:hypothetical protein